MAALSITICIFFNLSLFKTKTIPSTNNVKCDELVPCGKPLFVPVADFHFFRLDFGTCWEAAINLYADVQPKVLRLVPSASTFTFAGSPFLDYATGRTNVFLELTFIHKNASFVKGFIINCIDIFNKLSTLFKCIIRILVYKPCLCTSQSEFQLFSNVTIYSGFVNC